MCVIFLPGVGTARPNRAAWMPEAQWGVMTHYLADWQAREWEQVIRE